MKNVRTGIGLMFMLLISLNSCTKEEFDDIQTSNEDSLVIDSTVEDTDIIEVSKRELISGSYSISLAVVNGDTIDINSQWMDQTFVIESDGKGSQLLHTQHDSIEYTFTKPLEWYFNDDETIFNMRTKELDENGNPLEEWEEWVPYNILLLNQQEFWYGLTYGDFSMEFHLSKN